jgi:hypothetical protein
MHETLGPVPGSVRNERKEERRAEKEKKRKRMSLNSFYQYLFIEYLICVKHCSKCWECNGIK